MSPSLAGLVGSPTTQASRRSPRAFSQSSTFLVPLTATPSSSPVISRLTEPAGVRPASSSRATAATKAATAPFMSAAPRPYSLPFRTSPPKGSTDHAFRSPGGTTSVCPAKQKFLPDVPRRAYRFSTGAVPGSSKRRRWQVKPSGVSAASSTPRAPESSGVTLGQRIRAWARATGSSVTGSMDISRAAGR